MKNLYKTQRLESQLANGLDSILESKDRQRQAKLTRESKKSQQNKRHNTDILPLTQNLSKKILKIKILYL